MLIDLEPMDILTIAFDLPKLISYYKSHLDDPDEDEEYNQLTYEHVAILESANKKLNAFMDANPAEFDN